MEKKIMIIDDDHQARETITQELYKFGYTVESIPEFTDIYSALNRFKPKLFILDINLKGADGRTLCNEIKANLSYAHIPIILLTTLSYAQIGEIDCKADAILGKPIHIQNLLRAIDGLITV